MYLNLQFSAIVLLIALGLPSQAHDIYSPLVDSTGRSCCHDQDCRPAPYRVRATGVQMYVEGKWITVPNHTIQYRALAGDTGETAGGHWCGFIPDRYSHRRDYVTFCAILPPNATAIFGPSFALREDRARPVP
jgi:hypothetical protein